MLVELQSYETASWSLETMRLSSLLEQIGGELIFHFPKTVPEDQHHAEPLALFLLLIFTTNVQL